MSRSPRYRRIASGILAATTAGGLALLGIWFGLPSFSSYLAEKLLPQYGFQEPTVEISSVGLQQTTIQTLKLQQPGWRMELEEASIGYDSKELIQQKKIRDLSIERLSLALAENAFEILQSPASQAPSESEPFDLAAIRSLPAERIEIKRGKLSLPPSLGIDLDWKALIELQQGQDPSAQIEASSPELHANLIARLDPHQRLVSELSLSLARPLDLLEQAIPNWRQQGSIPPEVYIALNETNLRANGTFASPDDWNANLTLTFPQLGISHAGTILAASNISLQANLRPDRTIEGTLRLEVANISSDSLRLAPGQELLLAFQFDGHQSLQLQSLLPIAWNYDDGLATGKAGFQISCHLPSDDTELRLEGIVEERELTVSDHPFQAFSASFHGELDRISVSMPQLSSAAYLGLSLQETALQIAIPSDSDRITIAGTSLLATDALAAFLENAAHPAIPLSFSITSSELTTEIQLLLNPESRPSRFQWPEASIAGMFSLEWRARLAESSERYQVDSLLKLQNLAIQHPELSAEGLALTARLSSEALDLANLAAEPHDYPSIVQKVFETLKCELSWQANRIQTPSFTAEWTGGDLALSPANTSNDSLINLTSSFGAGIFRTAKENIQQIYASLASSGSLHQIDTKIDASFRYQGQDGAVTITSKVSDFLTQHPSLRSHFELSPLAFEYSDLLGRYQPSLQGVSFSGILSAQGQFEAEGETQTLTARASFAQGSVDAPGQQASAQGIELQADWNDIDLANPIPSDFSLSIENLKLGDLQGQAALLSTKSDLNRLIQIRNAQLESFGGKLLLRPSSLSLKPLRYAGVLQFERLSLAQIAQAMEFFEGQMEGKLTGSLPFRYENGTFTLEEGHLALPEGESAKLKYDARGIFGETPPPDGQPAKKAFADKLLELLEVDPEHFVEDALADLTIHDLDVQLFPKDSPNTPIRIKLAGEAYSGKTKVPLKLETNVNGTLEELYNFLIRLNSL